MSSEVEYANDGVRVYDSAGNLLGHFGHFETLADQIDAFSRLSVAYKQDGTQVASGNPRYEISGSTYSENTQANFATGTLTNVVASNAPDLELAKEGTDYSNTATLTADFNGTHSNTEAVNDSVKLLTSSNTGYGITSLGATETVNQQDHEIGWRFTVGSNNITATKLRIYSGSISSASRKIRLWRVSDQAKIAEVTVTAINGVWVEGNITPVTLTAGQSYIVSYGHDSGNYRYNNPYTLNTYSPAITFNEGRYVEGTNDFPIYTSESACFGIVDIYFQGITYYTSSGAYTHPEQIVSGAGVAGAAAITFNKTTPANTTLTVDYRISTDGGGTWGAWVTDAASGATIIAKATNLTNYRVQWRANLSTTDTIVTPALLDVTVAVTSACKTSGNRVSPLQSVTGHINTSSINWTANTPAGTTLTMEISWDGGATWLTCTSGSALPGTPSTSYMLKESLSTTDIAVTPKLQSLTITCSACFGQTILIEEGTTQIFPQAQSEGFSGAWTSGTLNGTYTVSIRAGTGILTLSGGATGTVSVGNSLTFTVSNATVTFTPSGGTPQRCQLEQKGYSTTWQDGVNAARNAEALTVQTPGVFTKGSWALEAIFTPADTLAGRNGHLCYIQIDANNYYDLGYNSSGYLYLTVKSGGTAYTITDNAAMTVGTPYTIMISGTGSVIRLCKNGAQIGSDLAYIEPVGTLPANMYIGSNSSGANQVNGYLDDLRISSRARTLAEHQAYVASGLPIPVDADTNYCMRFDGTLQSIVRRYGLKIINGEIDLNAPSTSGGIRVYDASGILKAQIGQYAENKYGMKVIGGEIYSSKIRTGAETDTDYIELGSGFEPLRVVKGGNDALTIFSGTNGGYIQVFNPAIDDMCGQILPSEAFYGANGLKIYARNNAGTLKNIALVGDTIYLDPSTEVNVQGNLFIAGNLSNTGNAYLNNLSTTGSKQAVQSTKHYGLRGLDARESPDTRYIDEGIGELSNGECKIDIDPIFLECIEPNLSTTPWVIHLTPCADNGIFVKEIGDTYFIVKESAAGISSNKFFWSLSAIRRGWAGRRLEELSLKDSKQIQSLMDKVNSSSTDPEKE